MPLREKAMQLLHLVTPFLEIRKRGSKRDQALPRRVEDQRARVIHAVSRSLLRLCEVTESARAHSYILSYM